MIKNSEHLYFQVAEMMESQLDDEIAECNEYTTIILKKDETTENFLQMRFSLKKYFTSLLTSLATISMLECVDGYETRPVFRGVSVAYAHCALSSTICNLISINESNNRIINLIDYAIVKSRYETKLSVINRIIPLDIYAENYDYNVSNQLFIIAKSAYEYHSSLIRKPGYLDELKSNADYIFCSENMEYYFCNRDFIRNSTIYGRCCPSIDLYIKNLFFPTNLPFTTSTTIISEPATIESTVFSTTVATTNPTVVTTNPTLVTTNIVTSENAVVIVLVLLLSLAIAVISFLGYRFFNATRESRQPQPPLESDNVSNEEAEDLV
ncbi:hypothetical protein [Candidatus Ichthyocystis sparus]|uniref:hypothetical protein n=1 Tax=Candidatus Ichthyocystis sparus TaxID=1561004 RepID=UPI000B845EB6|nr:hypothetical protein [Candidatus Ichthyocystis sparus]